MITRIMLRKTGKILYRYTILTGGGLRTKNFEEYGGGGSIFGSVLREMLIFGSSTNEMGNSIIRSVGSVFSVLTFLMPHPPQAKGLYTFTMN